MKIVMMHNFAAIVESHYMELSGGISMVVLPHAQMIALVIMQKPIWKTSVLDGKRNIQTSVLK